VAVRQQAISEMLTGVKADVCTLVGVLLQLGLVAERGLQNEAVLPCNDLDLVD
jgi:hypothetical protein